MVSELNAFRLGDIRGLYPDEINEAFVAQFAHAFVGHFGIQGKVATGRDMRDSSEGLQSALNTALSSIGIDVEDIGLCPTELGYFASAMPGIEAAIIVTASHNPAIYNGLKCVLKNGSAITYDNGLRDVQSLMLSGYRHLASEGSVTRSNYHERYLEFLSKRFPVHELHSGNIALNGLNGTAATMADLIANALELPVTWFRKNPGPIPSEGADPANPGLVKEMKAFMAGQGFSLGVAWDGDCDRCVCFDNNGDLIQTYYLIGLLTETFLNRRPGSAIVYDTKLCWNTLDIISRLNGVPIPSETGHAFMKQKMHQHNAAYGGELSAHHYFGEFFGCDSGMFAWLTVLQLLNQQTTQIHEIISERQSAVCCTPEISIRLTDVDTAFSDVLNQYEAKAINVSHFDGLSFEMPGDWRFTLRRSKTEPVVRLNFEARNTPEHLLDQGVKVFELLEPFRHEDKNWLTQFNTQ